MNFLLQYMGNIQGNPSELSILPSHLHRDDTSKGVQIVRHDDDEEMDDDDDSGEHDSEQSPDLIFYR